MEYEKFLDTFGDYLISPKSKANCPDLIHMLPREQKGFRKAIAYSLKNTPSTKISLAILNEEIDKFADYMVLSRKRSETRMDKLCRKYGIVNASNQDCARLIEVSGILVYC